MTGCRATWRGAASTARSAPFRAVRASTRGDRLVNYAVGSARMFGAGRIYMVERVVSEEPEPRGHERWPWVVEVEHVVSVPRLALAPELREIGVSPRSLSQHSHIRLSAQQGELAEQLIREAAADGLPNRGDRQ